MIRLAYVGEKPNDKVRACHDCFWCQKASSWWCVSGDANKEYGTPEPGRTGCLFWEPIKPYKTIPFMSKLCGTVKKLRLTKDM